MLPELQKTTSAAVVPDNIRAVQAIYAAWQLEQARVFAVVERIAALFGQGLLPLGRGRAAEGLAGYLPSGDRLTGSERADLYARTLGVPGGSPGGESNREFVSLWMRFVSGVALLQQEAAARARMQRAARALTENLSAHGGGPVATAALRLAADVRRLFDILDDPELQLAYGARDMWQVIDRVNVRDLGGARNVARYRTMSAAGSRILGWLADHADSQGDAGEPDADLIDAVGQWLAASNTPDEAIESWSTPTESPTTPFVHTDLPAMTRELLEALGADRLAWFQGARRTGKTLAAHLVAAALARDIYRIDLAAVVSKYLGETEKHLSRVFDEAEQSGAVLLIDEADELFGRRGNVKDAHDRYANIDVAWLIQRIENYRGLVIVASSAADDTDEACWRQRPRRLRFPRRP